MKLRQVECQLEPERRRRGNRIAKRGKGEIVTRGNAQRRHGEARSVPARADIVVALRKIEALQAPFVSRGDRSGAHMAELAFWKDAGVDLERAKGPWYRDTGQGMGPALNTAASMGAYILVDRGTWLGSRTAATS